MQESEDTERLQVYLAHAGIGSRRGVVALIEQGLIKVNGTIVKDAGFRVPAQAKVEFRGREVHPVRNFVYLALHKPPRYLCSNSDPSGRPLASSLFQSLYPQRLFHVGRLDYMSSGLIFYTNDGEFAKLLSHPSSRVEKEYEVLTKEEIPEEFLADALKGIYAEGERYSFRKIRRLGSKKVQVLLEEGRNREIRKVFKARRLEIKRLHRVRIGPIQLRSLQPGQVRPLTKMEIKKLLAAAAPA